MQAYVRLFTIWPDSVFESIDKFDRVEETYAAAMVFKLLHINCRSALSLSPLGRLRSADQGQCYAR